MTRIRFKGLRGSRTLSADGAPLSRGIDGTSRSVIAHLPAEVDGLRHTPVVPSTCHPGAMLLRLLREPSTGRPARGTRLLAVVLVVGMVGFSAPVLMPVFSWLTGLL